LIAVLVAALLMPLAIRRQQYGRLAAFSQAIARDPKTTPAAVQSYEWTAARAWADAVQYDWLIALLMLVPTFMWLLSSLGVFHRARLRALARQYQYVAPPVYRPDSGPSRFLSDDRGPYYRARS
jgi:hypothetical protein